jgi:PhnB protein
VRSATPYLCVHDAAAAIDFYIRAFGATEIRRYTDTDGTIGHAEIAIGDAHIMLSDEWPEGGVLSPKARGGTSVALVLDIEDVDALYARAIAAGATEERPPADQPWGDRSGWLVDPFGHRWNLSMQTEEVSPEELERRMGGAYQVT